MSNITIEIKAPELSQAILALAKSLEGNVSSVTNVTNVQPNKTIPGVQTPAVPIATAPVAIPTTAVPTIPTAPTTNAAPVTPAPQIQQPASAVPTSPQSYTQEQLAVAAMQLLDAGQNVAGLLASFGVQALTQLPKEQYGAFATRLRAMGAKI